MNIQCQVFSLHSYHGWCNLCCRLIKFSAAGCSAKYFPVFRIAQDLPDPQYCKEYLIKLIHYNDSEISLHHY